MLIKKIPGKLAMVVIPNQYLGFCRSTFTRGFEPVYYLFFVPAMDFYKFI